MSETIERKIRTARVSALIACLVIAYGVTGGFSERFGLPASFWDSLALGALIIFAVNFVALGNLRQKQESK